MNNKTNKRPIKGYLKILSIIILASLVFSFLVFHLASVLKQPLKTQTVFLHTEAFEIDTELFVIRNESYITGEAAGVYVPFVKNGERVAGGDTVSVVVDNEETASLIAKKKQIEEDLAYYRNLAKMSVSQTTDIARIDKDISKSVINYASIIKSGRLLDLKEASDAVRDNIAHRQMVTGTKIDFATIQASLEAEYARILDASKNKIDIIADRAGYFVFDVDGFENTLPYQSARNLQIDDIKGALKAEPVEIPLNVKGKIISDFDWYLACILDVKDIEALNISKNINIHLSSSAAGDIRVSLFKINEAQDGKVPVIFKADLMNEALTTIRKEGAKLRLEEYSGYRIDNRAIRMVDGEKGVYIKRGNLISFRKIKVLFTSEEYSIISKDDSQIKLYDEVVLEGTDLYDGKIVF